MKILQQAFEDLKDQVVLTTFDALAIGFFLGVVLLSCFVLNPIGIDVP